MAINNTRTGTNLSKKTPIFRDHRMLITSSTGVILLAIMSLDLQTRSLAINGGSCQNCTSFLLATESDSGFVEQVFSAKDLKKQLTFL